MIWNNNWKVNHVRQCVYLVLSSISYLLVTSNRVCFPFFQFESHLCHTYNICCGCFQNWRRCNRTTSWPCSSEYLITSFKTSAFLYFYSFSLVYRSCCHHGPRLIFSFLYCYFESPSNPRMGGRWQRKVKHTGSEKDDTKKVIHIIKDKIWWAREWGRANK